MQGAQFRAFPLDAQNDFALDADTLLALVDDDTKLVFACSPNNPTGTLYHEQLDALATALAGRALLVVDEAYIEFADAPSAISLIDRHANLAVLRTLSKAHGLAGARVGALVAREDVIDLVARIAPPYPLPVPSTRAALAALDGLSTGQIPMWRDLLAIELRDDERAAVAALIERSSAG